MRDPDNIVAIDKRFDKLLTSLRTAVAEEYKLDKTATSYNDILDTFRCLYNFTRGPNKVIINGNREKEKKKRLQSREIQ